MAFSGESIKSFSLVRKSVFSSGRSRNIFSFQGLIFQESISRFFGWRFDLLSASSCLVISSFKRGEFSFHLKNFFFTKSIRNSFCGLKKFFWVDICLVGCTKSLQFTRLEHSITYTTANKSRNIEAHGIPSSTQV